MELVVLGAFIIGLIIGFFLHYITVRKNQSAELADKLEEKLNFIIPKLTQAAGEQTALLAKEKLEASSKLIQDDVDNKRQMIEETVKRLHDELKSANEKLEKVERERVGSFSTMKEMMTQQAAEISKLSQSTTNLQRVLSNNQARGLFGEQVADELLKLSGFTPGIDYEVQATQTGERSDRPDFTVFLPDRTKLNIDVKFPYANLQRVVETEDPTKKQEYMKAFATDVRQKIKQIATRSYINPDENTVDFAIAFIPNEMIFSYIYEKLNDVWLDALKNKVILAGPFSFTAMLRLVRQSYANFRIQSNVRGIITQIKVFYEEFGKYNEEVNKLGERLDSATKQYQVVSQTRTNKLLRVIDKVQMEDDRADQPAVPLL